MEGEPTKKPGPESKPPYRPTRVVISRLWRPFLMTRDPLQDVSFVDTDLRCGFLGGAVRFALPSTADPTALRLGLAALKGPSLAGAGGSWGRLGMHL